MTTRLERLTHLVSHIKKIYIWHRRFEHTSNARIIYLSKLLNGIGDLSKEYDPIEIYSNSKVSNVEESLDLFNNSNPQNLKPKETPNNNPQTEIMNILKVFMITNLDFDKISKSYVGSKQTWVVRQ